jgi:hypothetical protein
MTRHGFNLRRALAVVNPDVLDRLPARPGHATLHDQPPADSDGTPAAPSRQRFTLVLEAGVDALGRPPAQRLRMLLKIAGRGLALRCLSVAAHDAANPAEGHP